MAQNQNPKKDATRRSRQRRRLPPEPVCVGCGETDPVLLEAHHPAGEVHDKDLIVVLCRNCHAKATEGQRQGEVPLRPTSNSLDRIVALLKAFGAFFHTIADFMIRTAQQLEGYIKALDSRYTDWRNIITEQV